MKKIGTKTIETKRLILRRFRIEDADDMYSNWASDPEVTKFLTWPTHESVEGTRELVNYAVIELPSIKCARLMPCRSWVRP